jgi:hypothetical protein
MGFLAPQISSPPPPPPPPPAANAPTYASSQVQAAGQGARNRMAAAAGAGFEGTLFTGPQGTQTAPTAKGQLLGT